MRHALACCLAALALCGSILPGVAQDQFTVLDQAQDAPQSPATPAPPPPVCGTKPINIAAMSWSSSALLAAIHARLLTAQFDCVTQVVPGDLAATGSSMGSTGQPAVAPEMWVGRIADVWNAAIKAQMVRPATTTYAEQVFEGWFMPDYMAAAFPGLADAKALKELLPTVAAGQKIRLISCPVDWACSIINKNLVRALGLSGLVELIEPANRFDMDRLIAEAVSKRQPVLLYYWQPNAVLSQFSFKPIDLGPYDAEAFKCLAKIACATPEVSSYAPENVVIALAEWVYADAPNIAAYFLRASLSFSEMNALLLQLNAPGASVESVADRFVAERADIWRNWVGADAQ